MVRYAGYMHTHRLIVRSKGEVDWRTTFKIALIVVFTLYTVFMVTRLLGLFVDGDIDTNLFLDWPRILIGRY